MGKVFSTGTLSYGGTDVGDLIDVRVSVRKTTISAPTNKRFPDAIANGPGEVTITAKAGNFSTTFVTAITNAAMAINATETQLVWTITDGTTTRTLTFANVVLESYDLEAKSDGFLATNITMKAAAAASGGSVMAVAATP